MNLSEIILKLKPMLEPVNFIHALWLEGSYATGKFNDESDIDVWMDVDQDKFQEAYNIFSQALMSLSLLRHTEKPIHYSEDPYLSKAKFYLVNKTDDQRIELDMQAYGRDFTFSRTKDKIVVLFDKENVISWSD